MKLHTSIIKKNEKGITLVSVLLMITVFTIIGMTLLGLIITNTKQVEKTESEIRTLDIAEMGFKYYVTEFNEFYDRKLQTIRKIIQSEIAEDYKNKELKAADVYEKMVADLLIRAIKTSPLVPSAPGTIVYNKTVDQERNFTVTIADITNNLKCITCSTTAPGEKIELTFKSVGTFGNYPKKSITSALTLNIGAIKMSTGGGGGAYETIIPRPSSLPLCNIQTFGSTSCSYKGDVQINHPLGIKSAAILVDGSIAVSKPINKGIVNSTLYVTKNAAFYSPINGIVKSKIFIGEDAQFKNLNLGIFNSTIVVMGDAAFNEGGYINSMIDSAIYINGNADFNKKYINLFGMSTKVCVRGTVSGLPWKRYYKIYSPTINQAKFNENCNVGGDLSPGDAVFDWSFDSSAIDYQYN
ncbi:hypothetical protein D0469_00195 [Peribacillus saganii]|uniref:Type 4 fimbrial biogenesis protein PilX N-terminal domain-containing protein n=1 Tax=Peribacillus saganii TaxID=2303992 RepID=A0A372LTR2_9BACI|nr:hypothetical protein [Peribacillus saganii]RFU71568.1 hypothetical protein D0469_00195 [Peribacillus saganii]